MRALNPSKVSFVGAGSQDPDLLTVRGMALLAEADVILHDVACTPVLAARVRKGATCIAVSAEGSSATELVAHAAAGLRVVRLVEGDPTFLGTIASEATALARAGISFEIVPGIPAFVIAAARAGVVIEPGVSVVTGKAVVRVESNATLPRSHETVLPRSHETVLPRSHETVLDATTEATSIPWPPRRGAHSEVGALATLAERFAKRQADREDSPGGQMLIVGGVPTLPWLESRPLFGRSILVTRARGQASETARALRARGAIPIELPTIVIGPPDDPSKLLDAARRVGSYDLVALTSANGVDALFGALASAGLDARAFGKARIAAIGPGTARALETRGIRADLIPEEHRGEALASEVLRDLGPDPNGKRILLPRAAVARDAFPDALRAQGVQVDVVAAYRTRAPNEEEANALRQQLRVTDVVVFTASSTVEQLFALVPDARALLAGVTIATIGPITTATCKKLGLEVEVEAAPYTIPALLDALEAHFAR